MAQVPAFREAGCEQGHILNKITSGCLLERRAEKTSRAWFGVLELLQVGWSGKACLRR